VGADPDGAADGDVRGRGVGAAGSEVRVVRGGDSAVYGLGAEWYDRVVSRVRASFGFGGGGEEGYGAG